MAKRLTIEEFIRRANEIHNFKYGYEKVVITHPMTDVTILCPEHGEFNQFPHSHLGGRGCYHCGLKSQVLQRTYTTSEFIALAIETHGLLYGYLNSVYVNYRTDLKIMCYIHGEFLQSPMHHLSGAGCPECGNLKIGDRLRMGIDRFIAEANIIHNNFYSYIKSIYKNNRTPLIIICPIHGEFPQCPRKHLMGRGCPSCVGRISKMETKFLDVLNIPNDEVHRQVRLSVGFVDGYDPITNTIYEFLGDYWHGNPNKYKFNDINKRCHQTFGELYNKTESRFLTLDNLGYDIKYMWETDWKLWDKLKNKSEIPLLTYEPNHPLV